MFKIDAKVRLVRHDQYPSLVGLEGIVTERGPRTGGLFALIDQAPADAGAEMVYTVSCPARVLYEVLETWLQSR